MSHFDELPRRDRNHEIEDEALAAFDTRLTGILWGWDTSDRFLFATRIEHVTALLNRLYP